MRCSCAELVASFGAQRKSLESAWRSRTTWTQDFEVRGSSMVELGSCRTTALGFFPGPYTRQFSGGVFAKVPPDPIPNSEVKLRGADGTARATWWESRKLPGIPMDPRNVSCAGSFFCAARGEGGPFRFALSGRRCGSIARAAREGAGMTRRVRGPNAEAPACGGQLARVGPRASCLASTRSGDSLLGWPGGPFAGCGEGCAGCTARSCCRARWQIPRDVVKLAPALLRCGVGSPVRGGGGRHGPVCEAASTAPGAAGERVGPLFSCEGDSGLP